MKCSNGDCNGKTFRWILAAVVLIALLCGSAAVAATKPDQAAQPNPPIVQECIKDLAKRLGKPEQDISVIKVQPVTWMDGALGLPEPGKMYTKMLVKGFRIFLQARGTRYLYTAGDTVFKYGGPVDSWAVSTLYLEPRSNDANLNSDLYQCSLLGTNSVLLVSEVSDYYPQANGVVIAKRRTSRSGHDLLYVKVNTVAQPVVLHGALDFGDAAVDGTGKQWAAYVRPRLGTPWAVVIGGIKGKSGDKQTLDLPEGVSPSRIAWSDDKLMILVKKGENEVCYQTSPKAEKPEWTSASYYDFPGMRDLVLNKSQSLGIEQVTENGKTAVKVAIVWFNGDEDPVARVEGVTMRYCDFLIGRYVFIVGEKDSKSAVYSVDIATGEIIPGLRGVGQNMKAFEYPPRELLLVLGKQN